MNLPLLSHEQRRDWLRLGKSENVGPATFRQLIARYGAPEAAIAALPELSRKGGLSRSLRVYGRDEAEADLERAAQYGARFVVPGEAGYPPLLRHIDGAPPFLCIKGEALLADKPAVAIVGARNASALGRKFARQLAAEIGAAGFVIVSGMARGIDTAAHEAALAAGTAAVLAGGIDVIYPPENQALHDEIGKTGLLITEMIPGTAPRAEFFPRRNRIISGMVRAVIVVEAALRSGSLITARLAAEQGREVFAVPGSPLDPRAEGCNKLIRDGASLLTRAADVLDALSGSFTPNRTMFLEPEPQELDDAADAGPDARRRLLSLLSPAPVAVDDLIRESALAPAAVAGLLLELELAGRIARHPRGLVSLA
ncbi:MAG: DNA-processing protein DprA [Hyphomicrobiales bacterium]